MSGSAFETAVYLQLPEKFYLAALYLLILGHIF